MISSVPLVAHPSPQLSRREFEKISQLAHSHFGLVLSKDKQPLVAARLGKVLRELGLKSFRDYYDMVQTDRSGSALVGMIDRLTTNHTAFFREPAHFAFLRQEIFPSLRERSRIDIWSAACSTGEEPYSIAMSLMEESPREVAAKVRIRASDISTRVLQRARLGIYDAARIAAIPEPLQQIYLKEHSTPSAPAFRFIDSIRSLIDFEHLNLTSPLPAGYRCSVLFCRNLMIYFDRLTQQSLVERLSHHIEEGGYLFIGHSESLNNISHPLEYVFPAIYRKPPYPRPGLLRNN